MAAIAADATEQPLISVVMCLFGVERLVAGAVRAILTQGWSDFELILVDDCATDRSLDHALSAAAGDPRVRVVRHDVNRGLSEARNSGMAAARGTYVTFQDPDDEAFPDFLDTFARAIGECDPDIVIAGLVEARHDGEDVIVDERALVPEATMAEGPREVASLLLPLETMTLLGYVNNKCFRRSLLEGLAFDGSISLSEDFFLSVAAMARARRVAVVDRAVYRYDRRPAGSLTGRFHGDYYAIHRRRIACLRDLLAERGLLDEGARSRLGALFGRYIVSALMRNVDARAAMDRSDRRRFCEEVFADPLFDELIDGASSRDGGVQDLALGVLRGRSVPLALALGRTTAVVGSVAAPLLARIQQHR